MTPSNQSTSYNHCSARSMYAYCCGTGDKFILAPSQWQYAIITVITLMAFFLNMIMAITVCCNRRLHTFSNVFAVSLAINDIFLALIASINAVFFGFHEVTLDRYIISLQTVFIFFASFTLICSHLNHLMISIERWLYIARPFLHQRVVTTKTITVSVIAVWILPLLCSAGLIGDMCMLNTTWVKRHFCIFVTTIHFVLSIAEFSIYGHIAVIARRQTRNVRQVTENPVERMDLETILINVGNTWKKVRIFVVVFGSYFVFTTPWVVINILAFSDGRLGAYNTTLYRTALTFALFQSYCNFLTHFMLDKDFMLVLKQCCGRIQCCVRRTKVNPFRHTASP